MPVAPPNASANEPYSASRAFAVARGCLTLAAASRVVSKSASPSDSGGFELNIDCLAIGSILLGQHDRDHTLGDRRVSSVRRMHRQCFVVVVDLEKDRLAVGVERAEVVFLIRVVGVMKVVKHLYGLDESFDGLLAQRGDARRDHGVAGAQVLSQFVIELANAVGIR